jgi:hypothetical protein
MARTEITYEHPPGSGNAGPKRNFDDAYMLESTRGPLRADAVVAGDRVKTAPTCKCLVLAVDVWTAE